MAQSFSAAAGWLLFVALVTCVGSVAARWLILPGVAGSLASGGPDRSWLYHEAARFGGLGSVALPVAVLLVFLRQIGDFRDPYAPLSEDVGLLLGTPWGTAWMMAVIASALVGVGFLLSTAGREWGWGLSTVAILGLAAFPGFTGHAGGGEGWLRLAILSADGLHVLAAGAWMGGLAVVLALERRWRRARVEADADSLLPLLVPRFSPVAMGSVAVLIVTGTIASWVHLAELSTLWTTGYGRLLVIKVTLVLVVLALGALNWKRLTPLLATSEGPRAMRRAAAVELSLAMLVLLVTAILVRTSPLGH